MEERLLKSLLQPDAYPDQTDHVILIQTHVSWIFLAGAFAYKVKKPVDFGFLNFSTLDRRMFYCHEEVRLNRRLCPEIYLGVVPLRVAASGAAFHGDGPIIDYAVKMVRLPADRMADRLLARGELTAGDMKGLAVRLAEFHRLARRGGEIADYGSPESIGRNWEENFRQAEEFAGITVSTADLRLIRDWIEGFMTARAELFKGRVAGEFIRECDGDIHLENICFADRICIFDCIEFNDRFRYTDTAADIAFPLMDLEYHGRRDLAESLLAEYLAASGDLGAGPLVGFYRLYRAFIRGKVESFRLKDAGISAGEKKEAAARAVRYFRLARGYVLREGLAPSLIILCGLTGSGKSTVAEALATELGLEVLSSDRIRKERAGIPLHHHAGDDYGAGIYSAADTEATYRELITRADSILASGRGVIADATCRKREDRDNLRRIAQRHGVPCYLIMMESPPEVIRQRLEGRLRQGSSISDGRWEIYLRQREEFEPLLENEGAVLTVDSSAQLHDTVDVILRTMGLMR